MFLKRAILATTYNWLVDTDTETIFAIFDALALCSSCSKPNLVAADLIQIASWEQFMGLIRFGNLCLIPVMG